MCIKLYSKRLTSNDDVSFLSCRHAVGHMIWQVPTLTKSPTAFLYKELELLNSVVAQMDTPWHMWSWMCMPYVSIWRQTLGIHVVKPMINMVK